jgi:TetR/AcrR family transcriptional repressor of mexJK operon
MVKKIVKDPALHPASSPKPRSRGRPRDPAKLQSVLTAAQREFGEHGFDGASVDAIARGCGVSKVTIYSYFPSKDALYEAVINRVDEAVRAADVGELDPGNPREALTRIGKMFLSLVRSPDVLASHRMVYGASTQNSAACKAFYEGGPRRTLDLVTDYLRAADRAGSLRISDPALGADQFLSMFLGRSHILALLGLAAPSPAEDRRLLKANVELFLRGYAA